MVVASVGSFWMAHKGDIFSRMGGFQLRTAGFSAYLPASMKMMEPRYPDVQSEQILKTSMDGAIRVRIIRGKVNGVRGPVRDIVIDPESLDVTVRAKNSNYRHPGGTFEPGSILFLNRPVTSIDRSVWGVLFVKGPEWKAIAEKNHRQSSLMASNSSTGVSTTTVMKRWKQSGCTSGGKYGTSTKASCR